MSKTNLSKQLPSSITVLGMNFSVIVDKLENEHGNCNIDTREIHINCDQTLSAAKATLLHEALHAAFAVSGQNEICKKNQEEALVRMLEHFLEPITDVTRLETV